MKLEKPTCGVLCCRQGIDREERKTSCRACGCTIIVVLWLFAVLAGEANPVSARDFGEQVEQVLITESMKWFGIQEPIRQSATPSIPGYRRPGQSADEQVILAKGLEVSYVTRKAAQYADQFAFWPNDDHPQWLMVCIEIRLANALRTGRHPAVQRIRLSDGTVETILRGLDRCDGIRRTPWGTLLATEEAPDGHGWEIIDPLQVTNHRVTNRTAGLVVDERGGPSTQVVQRSALPVMAWEGIHITPEGVVYAGDELSPGVITQGSSGGALYKFIPTTLHRGGRIADLADSPFRDGKVFALQVSCRDDLHQYGQGCEVGNGQWIAVRALSARLDALAKGATGYYRPEDIDPDPRYQGPGVRICWANTQNPSASLFAEIQCARDQEPTHDGRGTPSVVINRFVEGDADFHAFDNIAFQPHTGNLYVVEDRPNGDIFACLPDGADRDLKSDGCVKVLSVKDSSAEPTGFTFEASGTTAYFVVQHSDDANMPLVDTDGDGAPDFPTDDVLKVTGFHIPLVEKAHP